jgi:hypothetical protein
MNGRCRDKGGEYYGGRGIIVCDEWGRAEVFVEWAIENGYKEGLQIDREDNDGNYDPSNCRFVIPRDNVMNRRIYKTNKSGYEGVRFRKNLSKWRAYIQVNRKQIHIGVFARLKQAVEARNNYIIKNNLTEYKIQEWRVDNEFN